MAKIFVLGGAGFIGSHLCDALIREGHKVFCIDDLSTGKLANVEGYSSDSFSFTVADINRKVELGDIFRLIKPDYVFHYAATVGVKRVLEDPFASLKDIEGIKNALELSLKHGVKKFIYASSSEVYGESPELPQKENGILNPLLSYGAVKLIGEHFCQAYYKKYGLATCALRFFNVYGPRQEGSDYGFVVSIFIDQVLKGMRPTVFGDGSQTRDFTFVEDNVEAALRVMNSEKADGQIFNVGTGKQTSILDLALKIIEISGVGLMPEFLPPRSDFEILHRLPDVSKIKETLGFEAKIDLDEGLRRTINYYKKLF